MSKPYDPQVGDIWWFGTNKKHYLFLEKKECDPDYTSHRWRYELLCLETGQRDYTMYGTMNAHGDGWFKKVA